LRNIGFPVPSPPRECNDPNCPFHSTLSVRGRVLEGFVVRDNMEKTVIVRRDYHHYVAKYLRYERRHNHVAAHNPPCIDAKVGEKVKIIECRPLSKSVSYVVVAKNEGVQ
jgi:small subunit ribosomal protein S17